MSDVKKYSVQLYCLFHSSGGLYITIRDGRTQNTVLLGCSSVLWFTLILLTDLSDWSERKQLQFEPIDTRQLTTTPNSRWSWR